jgi:hypothetical protein
VPAESAEGDPVGEPGQPESIDGTAELRPEDMDVVEPIFDREGTARRGLGPAGRFVLALAAVLVLVALAVYSRHVYRTRFAAAGRAAERGWGVQLERPPVGVSDERIEPFFATDSAHIRRPEDGGLALLAYGAYQDVLYPDDGALRPPGLVAHAANNAAMLLATDPRFFDPEAAVDMAMRALDAGGYSAMLADTYAEALAAAGHLDLAVAVSTWAVDASRGDSELAANRARFVAVAEGKFKR